MPRSTMITLFLPNRSSNRGPFHKGKAVINVATAIAMPKLRSGLRVSARTAKLMAYKIPWPNKPVKIRAATISSKSVDMIVAIWPMQAIVEENRAIFCQLKRLIQRGANSDAAPIA